MAEAAYAEPDAKVDVMAHEATNQMHSNKRKRSSLEHDPARPAPTYQRGTTNSANNTAQEQPDMDQYTEEALHGMTTADFNALTQHNQNGQAASATDTAAAALSQHYSMTAPGGNDASFQSQGTAGESSFDLGEHHPQSHGLTDFGLGQLKDAAQPQATNQPPSASSSNVHKPAVGSEEWHKVRRDNHKEVERRRRETINEGINELAKIVPGCEKNKGSILQRAVQYIGQLKENEAQNIEKWTLEKLLTEQAIAELSTSCEKFKAECHRAWQEVEVWKKAAEKAGVKVEDVDTSRADAAAEGETQSADA